MKKQNAAAKLALSLPVTRIKLPVTRHVCSYN